MSETPACSRRSRRARFEVEAMDDRCLLSTALLRPALPIPSVLPAPVVRPAPRPDLVEVTGFSISVPKITIPRIPTPKLPTPKIPVPKIPTPKLPGPVTVNTRTPAPDRVVVQPAGFPNPWPGLTATSSVIGNLKKGTHIPIEDAVLNFVRAQEGLRAVVSPTNARKDGQCTDLASVAIAKAGGVPMTKLGPTGDNADYVWGDLVTVISPGSKGNTAAIESGEVIQFQNATFVEHLPNGSWVSYTNMHHTAVTTTLHGGVVGVEEQNGPRVNGVNRVEPGYYVLGDGTPGYSLSITAGTIKVYRPYKVA